MPVGLTLRSTRFGTRAIPNRQSGWACHELGRFLKSISAPWPLLLTICLQMGEDPTGFISKHQALRRGDRKAEEIAAEIDGILAKDPRTRDKLRAAKDALR